MQTSEAAALNAVTGLTRERVRALDLAAGLAVFFMILVHVLWHWGAPETWTTPIGEAISYAAGPTAAPVFTFLMGVSLGAAPRSSVRTLVARGLWLVLLGYVLNLLRGVIPGALGFATGVITPDQVAPYTLWWLATTVDLHHVIGLSMVVIAVLRTRTRPGWLWLGVGGALVLAAPWLRSVTFGTPILDAPLTPVIGSAPNVYYAVVPWLVYPLAGAVFGAILARASGRIAVFRRGAALGLVLLVLGGLLIMVQRPGFDVFTYWRQPASFVVAIFGVILVWLALCDVVTRRRWIDRHLGVVYGWSDRVIAMYFTHWIIVGWGIVSSVSGRWVSDRSCWRWSPPWWPRATARGSRCASRRVHGSAARRAVDPRRSRSRSRSRPSSALWSSVPQSHRSTCGSPAIPSASFSSAVW